MPEKLRLENLGQKQQIRPENPGLLVPEKKARKSRQVTTDTTDNSEYSAASNCRYDQKILASNYLIRPENSAASNCRYGRKIPASNCQIRPENSASGNYRNGRKIPARNRINAITSYIQRCSGIVVEHLVHNLKVGGSRPPCAQILFRYTAGIFRWRRKLNRKFRPTCQKLFLLYVRNESEAPGLGSGKSRQAL